MKIKREDTVLVTTGEYKGDQGRVLDVDHATGKIVVEGVNKVYKHVRRSQKNPQGGRLSKEMPIPISNVKLMCPSCNSAVRVGLRMLEDGGKERYCKKCGSSQGRVSPAKTSDS